jgi:endonuclease V-like protein UPF0215 family
MVYNLIECPVPLVLTTRRKEAETLQEKMQKTLKMCEERLQEISQANNISKSIFSY